MLPRTTDIRLAEIGVKMVMSTAVSIVSSGIEVQFEGPAYFVLIAGVELENGLTDLVQFFRDSLICGIIPIMEELMDYPGY